MRIPRIYQPGELVCGSTVTLGAAALRHAVRVLRLRPGSPLILFNGNGGAFNAILTEVDKRQATARVEGYDSSEVESPLPVTLLQGISRGERMDIVFQKAVELGAHAIQPLITARSVGSPDGQRLERRMQHWRGVVTSACEQSGRNRIPKVYEPRDLMSALRCCSSTQLGLMLDPGAASGVADLRRPSGAIALLIGPEGGIADHEKAAAEAAGFMGVRLGPRVMRTETAGAAALAVLQAMWGDLGY